ncbi:hypothetical protein [Sphingomonas sp. PR090111-T3T-6A]|uniref:hypothetical protein n=1 Tax=Sphingomonas sp. PR090111-T3T-6A TaxID=685778 RepID=UPI00036560CE|nr:hypothetical protein [Sphingomonas sp. PR090111-T3T-6A]
MPISEVGAIIGHAGLVLDRFLKDVGTFRMLWPPSRHLTPRLRAFVDFMTQHLFADISNG